VFLLSADNQPGVIMNGTDGEPRVVMRVNDENRASLQLAGANAKGGIGFSISRTRIMLGLTDNDGRLRFLTYLDRNGLPGIRLSDADGKTLWQAP
jgi:hypothetical protein